VLLRHRQVLPQDGKEGRHQSPREIHSRFWRWQIWGTFYNLPANKNGAVLEGSVFLYSCVYVTWVPRLYTHNQSATRGHT
jgi:hypothetical protein